MTESEERFGLIQEELQDHSWKLLVACMMLNQTSAKQVRNVIWNFFDKFPDPVAFVSTATVEEIVKIIRPLGLYNRRALALLRMTQEFLSGNWKKVDDIYGIGKYAADSYCIFFLKEVPVNEDAVDDKELKNYIRWYNEK